MNELIETIRNALDPNANESVKQAGANACRAVLAALEAQPGQPLAPPPMPNSPMAMAVQQMRSAPPSFVLDALIAKLKSHLPDERAASKPSSPLKIPFVSLPAAKKEG